MSENALMPAWSQYAYASNRLYANLASQLAVDYYTFQTSLSVELSDAEWSKYVFDQCCLLTTCALKTAAVIKSAPAICASPPALQGHISVENIR